MGWPFEMGVWSVCTPKSHRNTTFGSKPDLVRPRAGRIGTLYAILFTVQKQVPISAVLRVQSIGFLAIIVISWFDELVDLRALIFGGHPYISDFRGSTLEMLLVLAVWLVVVGATRRVIQRVH